MQITENQWKIYEKKYGKLMIRISQMITGDVAICSPEDNYADLIISAMDSIKGFYKKTNKTFDEMITDPNFDKYTKTVLWHAKGNKGSKIAQKYHITRDCVRTSKADDAIYDIECHKLSPSSTDNIIFMKDTLNSLEDEEVLALDTITKEPVLVKPNGKINYQELGNRLNISRSKAEGIIRKIKRKIGDIF